MIMMVDGVGTDVPAIFARFGTEHPVGGYVWQPGVFSYIPWKAAQLALFPAGHMLTATLGGYPLAAKWARELDVETGDANAHAVCPWLEARHDFGHQDGQVYCDLTHLGEVLRAIRAEGLWDEPWWRLRVAWWWQRPGAPDQDQVLAEIDRRYPGENLEPGRVWGCQYFGGGSYDLTAVYGVPDFTRPTP